MLGNRCRKQVSASQSVIVVMSVYSNASAMGDADKLVIDLD